MSNKWQKVTKTNRHYGEAVFISGKEGWSLGSKNTAMKKWRNRQYLYGSTEAEFAASCGIGKADGNAV